MLEPRLEQFYLTLKSIARNYFELLAKIKKNYFLIVNFRAKKKRKRRIKQNSMHN